MGNWLTCFNEAEAIKPRNLAAVGRIPLRFDFQLQ